MDLKEALHACGHIHRDLGEILNGQYQDDRRTMLALGYCSLGFDHHAAITMLFHEGRRGSGLALVRPVFEAMIRAHWVVGCATDEQVNRVAEDLKFFDVYRINVDDIDKRFGTEGFFRAIKAQAWSAMNDYTHSGLRQLTHQFSDGRVIAKYRDDDLLDGLRAATASMLLLGHLLASRSGTPEKVAAVDLLFERVP